MNEGLHALDCEKCGAALTPPDAGAVVKCPHCGQPHMWVPPRHVAPAPAPIAPVKKQKNKTAIVIVVVLAVVGLLIAVGGSAALIVMRRSAPNEAFEAVVTPGVPLLPGDIVTFRENNYSCSGIAVLGLAPNDRVIIPACQGDSRPIPVARSLLRLPRFPNENGIVQPETGDIVLALANGRYLRAEIVAPEPGHRLRLAPLRVAPDALDVDRDEIVVPQGSVYLVQRASMIGGPLYAPLGKGQLLPGDQLEEHGTQVLNRVRVLRASPGEEDVIVTRQFDDPPVERTVSRRHIFARVLRPYEEVWPGDVLFEPTAQGPRRVIVVRDGDEHEACVRDEGSDPTSPCRNLPKTAVFRVQSSNP